MLLAYSPVLVSLARAKVLEFKGLQLVVRLLMNRLNLRVTCKETLLNGFKKSFKIELAPGETIEFKEQLVAKLKAEKYATKEWNFKR